MYILNQRRAMIIIFILMLLSFIFVFFTNGKKSVEDYNLTEDLIYTGTMEYGVFSGEGILQTPEGRYEGNFYDGRFSDKGSFTSTDKWVYEASFIPKKTSKNVIISLDGKKYKKEGKKWKK